MWKQQATKPAHGEPDLKYRPDIDGLRGIAVLAVVIFHAFPALAPGGFVGVDIFFVLSGFLISRILFRELDSGEFRFMAFFSRRVLRLFPALLLVLFACLAAGWQLKFFFQLKQLGAHLLAASGFALNFVLWKEAGYFDSSSITKPLNHLWSLGVEEQFYLLWPLTLFVAKKLKLSFLTVTASAAAASFVVGLAYLGSDLDAAYFSPFSRFWELTCGGLLACATRSPHLRCGRVPPDLKAGAGFLLIAGAILCFAQGIPFPGWWALLPVVGTVLVMSAGEKAWLNRNFLSCRPLVGVGVVSYPFYLWHWPLLSFAYLMGWRSPQGTARIACVALSFALACLTYWLVERPIRGGGASRFRVLGLCALMGVVGCAGLLAQRGILVSFHRAGATRIVLPDELGWFEPDPACVERLHLEPFANRKQTLFCSGGTPPGKTRLAILGDCAANDLYPGLKKVFAEKGISVINLGGATCAPFRGIYGKFQWNKDCNQLNQKIYAYVLSTPEIKTVILAYAAWDVQNMGFEGVPFDAPLAAKFSAMTKVVNHDIEELKRAGKSVVLNYDSPHLGVNPAAFLQRREKAGMVSERDLVSREPFLSFWRTTMADRTDVCQFFKFPQLLDGGSLSIWDPEKGMVFRGDHNLSLYGSEQVAHAFADSECAPRI